MNKIIFCTLFSFIFTLVLSSQSRAENRITPSLYAYETAKGFKVGAVFGVLPALPEDDELISASSPICDHIEIHTMKEENGIFRMRQIFSIPLKKNKAALLPPTGDHLMLMQLTKPLTKGDSFPLTLKFKKAAPITIEIPVLSRINRDGTRQH